MPNDLAARTLIRPRKWSRGGTLRLSPLWLSLLRTRTQLPGRPLRLSPLRTRI
jgi:hypothetical protein